MTEKKVYFASDVHLGAPNFEDSQKREKKFVKWLDQIKDNALEIYLLGDIFDYWFEYRHTVLRGFSRFLGKICEITDSGIPVYFFTGNHDMWVFDYLPRETGMIIQRKEISKEILGKQFYLAHGDGLGPGDYKFKILKKIFTNRILQWLYARVNPNFTARLAYFWSHSSRKSHNEKTFLGEDKEWLIIHSKNELKKKHHDYFIFGHRHLPIIVNLNETSKYVNLGDWIVNFTYAVFDGNKLELLKY